MRIILDTGVLWKRRHLERLEASGSTAILPAVAFAERARQLRASQRSPEELWRLLDILGIEVEPMGPAEAASRFALLPKGEEARARDAFIAGHVGPDDVLWTTDPDDFLSLGLPAHQVVAIG